MIKKQFAIFLLAVVTGVSFNSVTTSAQTTIDPEKTRAAVQTLSVDRDKKIEVKLRDKTKVKGYISSVEPDSFTVKDPKSGSSQTIAYAEVDTVKRTSSGLSTKGWLIIGGIAAGAITGWLIAKPAVCDGGAQTRGIC